MYYYLLGFIFFINTVFSQENLVPNYSFEDTTGCPYDPGKIYFAPPWGNGNWGSCDLFHTCSISYGVPINGFGYQKPKTRKAYAGLVMYNGGEYLSAKLKEKLVSNKKYCVTFHVSLAEISRFAIDKIGLYFSDTAIYYVSNLIPLIPQIENTHGNILVDSINWINISGTYVSHGGEEYIVIGSFYDSANTDILQVSNNNNAIAYYYIDDVSVVLCEDTLPVPSDTFYLHIPNVFTPNADGKNDTWQVNANGVQQLRAAVYNRWGTLLWQQEVQATDTTNQTPTISWDGRSNTGMPASAGTYYYLVTCTTKEGEIKKEKGFLTLTR